MQIIIMLPAACKIGRIGENNRNTQRNQVAQEKVNDYNRIGIVAAKGFLNHAYPAEGSSGEWLQHVRSQVSAGGDRHGWLDSQIKEGIRKSTANKGIVCTKGCREEKELTIYVDADACPVVRQVEAAAKKHAVPVMLLCDTNHVIHSEYSEVQVIGAGMDAVDFALINRCKKGDIVVTQDYGVAALALGKGAYAIHQSGRWYTNENIDQMLMERHIAKTARRASGRNHLKGPKKRVREDDEGFFQSFERLIEKAL